MDKQEELRVKVKKAYQRLAGYLLELAEGAKQDIGEAVIWKPQAGEGYIGMWPDDGLYPLIALPSLANPRELSKTLEFITDSVIDLEYLPDRIEPDGLPILSPGPSHLPLTYRMPLHLPAAWVRLLHYYENLGAEIPQKKLWAKLIERSFNRVPFANGLVYADLQNPPIGYGFHDTIKIAGWELMCSLVIMRGLERAISLFEKEVSKEVQEDWKRKARRIRENLYRLYDEKIGGYLGGSRIGRQFSVWANGLAYWLAPEEAKERIVEFYRKNAERVFKLGCTRQIAEEGWEGNGPGDSYQNGGFWATGTGYVLPAIADRDPDLAVQILEELVDNLPKIEFAEWIGRDGKPSGALRYVPSVAMPMIGLRSILEEKPLIEYF